MLQRVRLCVLGPAARLLSIVLVASVAAACVTLGPHLGPEQAAARKAVLSRAEVWRHTNVRAMDLKRGPQQPGAFPFGATVVCSYRDKQLEGSSPKFACVVGSDDEVKVKFGGANGEVYGEVLAASAPRRPQVARGLPSTHRQQAGAAARRVPTLATGPYTRVVWFAILDD